MSSYNKEASRYKDLKGKLQKRPILNIHIPGTGGRATSSFPTYWAVKNATKLSDAATLYLEGVGSNGSDYIAPCRTNPYTLEPTVKTKSVFATGMLTSTSEAMFASEMDVAPVAALTETGANVGGIALGIGEHENIQLVLNTLQALDEDACLPKEIVLTGHSRGAINCILLANKIYQKFGHDIKLHLCLTDPVPGPFHSGNWEKRVIPPSAETFTAFYADREAGLFFVPHDLSRLVFTNKKTTITSYSTANTHNGDDSYPSICSNYNVTRALTRIVTALNGKPSQTLIDEQRKVEEMKSDNFFRADCQYHCATPISKKLRLQIQSAIQDIRAGFDADYKPKIIFEPTIDPITPLAKSRRGKKAELERRIELRNHYLEQKGYDVSLQELLACLLILPTLGFSANYYNSAAMMETQNKVAAFLLGLVTLNIVPALFRIGETTLKLAHNIAHGGFFRAPSKAFIQGQPNKNTKLIENEATHAQPSKEKAQPTESSHSTNEYREFDEACAYMP